MSAGGPNADLVVFLGAGDGAGVDALGEATRAVVLEPDAGRVDRLLGRPSWTARTRSGRLAVLVGPDYAGASGLARRFPDLHRASTIVDPSLLAAEPDAVARLCRVLEQAAFDASANQDARRASAGRYLLHTLANAPRIARESDARALDGCLEKQPAIIVAAGPSLDRNLHELALVRDRAAIIACDTAARPLLSAALEPDLVVAADPSRANAAHLCGLPPARSWLVAEGSLHPSAFVHFDRHTFFFKVAPHEPWPWLAAAGVDRGTLDTWGSVATTALSLAIAAGADPIVFMGADFAFSRGRPYCRGTTFETLWASWAGGGGVSYERIWTDLIDRWPAVSEPDVHGEPVRTAAHLRSFRDWIVERTASHADRRFVNATGAGLLHGGRVRQQTAVAALGGAAPIDRRALHADLASRHARGRASLSRILDAARALVEDVEGRVPDAWLAFTDGAVTSDRVRGALQSPELQAWTIARGQSLAAATRA